MRRVLALIVMSVSLALPVTPVSGEAIASAGAARPATYGIAVEPDVRITMSDGVVLNADVARPADDEGRPVPGRFPVLLTYTPYGKKPAPVQKGNYSGVVSYRSDYMVSRGYVHVVAEVRGTGSSGGTWEGPWGPREQLDGPELVAWAASSARPWSNGAVGLFGSSYAAINQIFTAAHRPPALRTIAPVSTFADLYRDIVMAGGQADSSFLPLWATLVTGLHFLPPGDAAERPADAAAVMAEHSKNVFTFQGPHVVSEASGGERAFDGPWYRKRSTVEVIDQVEVPTLLVGGWFDLFPRGTPILFERLAARGVPAHLIMGPWNHFDIVGQIPGGPNVKVDGRTLDELQLDWFDRHLAGRSNARLGSPKLAPVTYCAIGKDACDTAAAWPPPRVSFTERYLAGPATPGVQAGTLQSTAPGEQPPDALPWHTAAGFCSRSWSQWGWSHYLHSSPCDHDQRVNDPTGLTYDLPLAGDLELAGPVTARLFVSTSGRDGFLSVRLEDVAPDGRVSQLAWGGNVISLRALDLDKTEMRDGLMVRPYHPFTKESVLPVRAGEVYEVAVEVFPTAARLPAGHTLRLAVQPSDWPHVSPPGQQSLDMAGSVLRVHHDRQHPSRVVLPVVGR